MQLRTIKHCQSHLLHKLEVALLRTDLETKTILPIFIYLAQKGEKLSNPVIQRLLDQMMNENDLVLKQELLSSLGSLMDANQGEIKSSQEKIDQILIREIKSENYNIQKLCVLAIEKLATVTRQLDDQLLHELVQVGTDFHCNKMIRSEIFSLFDSIDVCCNFSIQKNFYREKNQACQFELQFE